MFYLSLFIAISIGIAIAQEESCLHVTFQVNPIPNSFAAEVIGLNLETVNDKEFELVNYYLVQHKVLVFRDQSNLTVEGQRNFSLRFGPLQVHLESSSHLPGYPDVNVISNLKNNSGIPIGLYGEHVENFHTGFNHKFPLTNVKC